MRIQPTVKFCLVVIVTTFLVPFTYGIADHKSSHAGGVTKAIANSCPPFLAEKIVEMLDTDLIGVFGSALNSSEGNTRNNPLDCKITSASFVYSVQIFTGRSEYGSFQRSGVNFAANSLTEYFSDELSSDQAASCAALVGCTQF